MIYSCIMSKSKSLIWNAAKFWGVGLGCLKSSRELPQLSLLCMTYFWLSYSIFYCWVFHDNLNYLTDISGCFSQYLVWVWHIVGTQEIFIEWMNKYKPLFFPAILKWLYHIYKKAIIKLMYINICDINK